MNEKERIARLRALGNILAQKNSAMLAAINSFLGSVLEATKLDVAAGRMPTVPVALTAEQVLEAARARGVPAFAGAAGDRMILLSSLGLDLTDAGIRTALIEMHRRGELHLASIDNIGAACVSLAARGLRIDLVEESAIDDEDTILYVVVLS